MNSLLKLLFVSQVTLILISGVSIQHAHGSATSKALIPFSDFKLLSSSNQVRYVGAIQEVLKLIDRDPVFASGSDPRRPHDQLARLATLVWSYADASSDQCISNGFVGHRVNGSCEVKNATGPGFIDPATMGDCPITRACAPIAFGLDAGGRVHCFKTSAPEGYDEFSFKKKFDFSHKECERLKTAASAESAAAYIRGHEGNYEEVSLAINQLCFGKSSGACRDIRLKIENANLISGTIGDGPGDGRAGSNRPTNN